MNGIRKWCLGCNPPFSWHNARSIIAHFIARRAGTSSQLANPISIEIPPANARSFSLLLLVPALQACALPLANNDSRAIVWLELVISVTALSIVLTAGRYCIVLHKSFIGPGLAGNCIRQVGSDFLTPRRASRKRTAARLRSRSITDPFPFGQRDDDLFKVRVVV
jgi:hypothetical protein